MHQEVHRRVQNAISTSFKVRRLGLFPGEYGIANQIIAKALSQNHQLPHTAGLENIHIYISVQCKGSAYKAIQAASDSGL